MSEVEAENQGPEEVHRLNEVLESLPGMISAFTEPVLLDGMEVSNLSLPGEFGDLPQVAIMRTEGGLDNEMMIRCCLHFERTEASFLTIEFLSWWVRDWARSGHMIQMRTRALPPRTDHVQLGATLRFFIEYFHTRDTDEVSESLNIVDEMANSIASNFEDYADCFDSPADVDAHDDIGVTFEQLKEYAESDGAAAYQVAVEFRRGELVAENEEEAFRWFMKGVELGDVNSHFFAGYAFKEGEVTDKDMTKAIELMNVAADSEHPLALATLGGMYVEGDDVEVDIEKGFALHQRGAATGHPICLAELGDCYEFGNGTEVDLKKALILYEEALAADFDMVEEAIARVKSQMEG